MAIFKKIIWVVLALLLASLPAGTAGIAQGAEPAAGIWRVVVDPGHGGNDHGVVGATGLTEARLTMALARQLKVVLEENPRIRVFLTRKVNENPTVHERTAVVNRIKGQVFISLHAGGIPLRSKSGFSVYYQDYSLQKGLANKVSLSLPKPGKMIDWDMAQGPYLIQSRRFGSDMAQALKAVLRVKGQTTTGLPLAILAGAGRPAIMVEVGYLTNPKEERRLKSQSYRDALIRALVKGIGSYRQWASRRVGN